MIVYYLHYLLFILKYFMSCFLVESFRYRIAVISIRKGNDVRVVMTVNMQI